ncbi:sensor histidine kinase [candidate division KSB1 bacterium]|nr:sensor histidine kinase [candidate division KSB1 bacterium]
MRELSLHILDIVQNSIAAKATRIEIDIVENSAENRMLIRIADNGAGMTPEILARVSDPFYTTREERKVGFGVALFKDTAIRAAGNLTIESEPSKGTTVTVNMELRHVDRLPLGDITETIVATVMSKPEIALVYRHRIDERKYCFESKDFSGLINEDGGIDFRILNRMKRSIQTGLGTLRNAKDI